MATKTALTDTAALLERVRAATVLRDMPEDYDDLTPALVAIARAILAAEQRGAERERERCAGIADEMREKYGSPTGDAYDNGLWDQSVRIATAIRKDTP